MGVSPIPFIFAQLWFLCAAVRPSIDEEDLGHRASLLLESNEVSECPEEVQEKLRGQLQGLGLSGEGDPCFWNGMGCLHCKVLRIWSKEASGDLSSIKEMTKLRDLRLAGSRITGNVSELSKLKDLVRLHLSQTEVMGDLAELSKLTALEDLRLPHTQVSGNVAKLSKLKELWHLDLAQTEVMGDLAELSKLTALKYLHLPHTQVAGDVSMLSNMTGLRDLSLAQSRVHGNFGVISSMPNLVKADLSSTAVSGNLGDLESDCCKKLRELHLGDTQVRISGRDLVSLPVLQSLNVSGCNLNVSFIDLFYRLHVNPITILLARGCGITGEVKSPWFLPSLWRSLQLFDLSGNRLDAVHALPAKLRLDVSHNEIPLRVSRDVIKSAAKSGTDLWMMNTELANREEIMSNCSNELQMEEMWISRETGGYWCHDLIQPNFRVTPERFLPQLMCACGPGHFGAGTNCSACPEDTFNDQMDQRKCQACPEGGKAPAGSQALSACKCPYGTPGKFENETMCLCDRNEALSHAQKCVSCTENNVLCSSGADRLATAPLKDGYIRLKEPSEEIFECLDPQHCRNSSCAPGRAGALCASCAQDYRSSKKVCVECKNVSSEKRLSIGLGCATALLILAATAWRLRHHLPQPSPRAECLLQLIIAQLAVLLQLTQLWTVLGDLAPAVETAANVAPVDDSAQGDPLLGYLEALQFTSSELQNFLALQCVYDGVTVRSLFALATPLVPLLLLIACGCGEVFSRGLGIRIGLKTLTVLFIGGASGSAQLLGCQRTDGAGAALKEFAFRPLFPHERCDEALWVDRIGWATAICYGLVIPCFLGFLFAKQNVVMRKVKTAVMQTARNEGKVIVRLQGLESEQSFKDATLSKRLLAGAAACVAVDGKGRALVEVQNDAVIVTPTTNISRASEDLGVESLVFGADVKEAEVLQRHVMAQMLMERSILEQETDRVMLGAKELFCKYAKCENVWMEVCTKVASAALVSVVAVDNLWLCVTITLGMALVIGLAQPFAQPQINVLQSACFGCLALAAVGFRHHMALARLALAVPFVLLVLQLRRPDSPEMLALRLQQELEAKIHEGPVEVSAEQFT